MKKSYLFGDHQSFRSADSQELASTLSKLSPTTLRRLKENLGITVEFEANPLRLAHDGRKVGIASVSTVFGNITIAVAPKLESLRVKAILNELDGVDQLLPQFVVSSQISTADIQLSYDDLSVSFLLALLKDILTAAPLLRGLSARRHVEYVRGGVRGRPLIEKSLIGITLGQSLGFTCEVLSDKHLREYELVLLTTALNIIDTLGIWTATLYESGLTPESMRGNLVSAFGNLDVSGITFSTVLRVCRPPFPFGLRDLLYRCLRYWRWRGSYAPSDSPIGADRFIALSINLDKLFEIYVGRAINRAMVGELSFSSSLPFDYSLDGISGKEPHDIILDHLFITPDESVLVIVDAKYTEKFATPPQVYQMISYTNFKYLKYPEAKTIGVLVYPGDELHIGTISGFNKPIYALTVPVPITSAIPALRKFLQSTITGKS